MRRITLILLTVVSAFCADAPEKKPAFTQPIPELKLTNGAVFKNVTVVRYTKETVVLKSNGGIGPLPYSYIPEPVRSQMLAERDSAAKTPASKPVEEKTDAPKAFKGEIFIVTRGRTNYKLGNTAVLVYPLQEAVSGLGWLPPSLPEPVAKSSTDSEGRFSFSVKASQLPVLIRVRASRLAGNVEEVYEWRIASDSVSDPTRVILSNSNLFSSSER